MDEYLRNTVYLECPAVLSTSHKWLKYQNSNVFTQLCVLKDLRLEMQISANSPILKGENIDYDQKFKNAGYVKDLSKMIIDCESELIQQSEKLKEAYREVKQAVGNKNTKTTEEIFAQHG